MRSATVLLLSAALLAGCPDESDGPHGPDIQTDAPASAGDVPTPEDVETPPDLPKGDGLFLNGCPEPEKSTARMIVDPEERPHGPDGLASPGDALIMNERAAFVISQIENNRTYWYYGGILIDAVALDGCAQAGEERFEELVPMLGRFDLGAPIANSVLRGFRGESIEIIADGSDGGDAIVRVAGVDDTFWLVELELMGAAFAGGAPRTLDGLMGVEVWIDYVLKPGAATLEIRIHVQNTLSEPNDVLVASALWLGDTTSRSFHAKSQINLGGFGLDVDLPWIAAQGPDGSLAFGVAGGKAGSLSVSGVTALLNIEPVLAGASLLDPVGGNDTLIETLLVAVGPGDANSATRELQPFDSEKIPGLSPVDGTVTEADGTPVVGLTVDVEIRDGDEWSLLDRLVTNVDGEFSGQIGDFGDEAPYRLRPRSAARNDVDPAEITLPASNVAIVVSPAGALTWDVTDEAGTSIPSRIMVYRKNGGALQAQIYALPGTGQAELPPGDYQMVVLRGYEYTRSISDLTVPAEGGTAHLVATLTRALDTTGWLSMDSHIHAGPSPDSDVSIKMRVLTAAANGLEVAISTDHEFVADWSAGVTEQNLGAFVRTVVGEEVTATLPEHMNMYPVPVVDHPRGDPILWYGLSMEEILGAMETRGAGVRQLNHPNYLDLIGWNGATATPFVKDATNFGAPGKQTWSWNFNAVELLNGGSDIFSKSGKEGLFDRWMGWWNHDHNVTGVAVTDTHGMAPPGDPRSYFPSPTDDPGAGTDAELEAAVVGGKVLLSTGAFAVVTANGAAMGDLVKPAGADGQTVELALHIQALPEIAVDHVVVFVNCDRAMALALDAPGDLIKHDGTVSLTVDKDATVIVAGFGAAGMPKGFKGYNGKRVPKFMTNPFLIDGDKDGVWTPVGDKSCSYTLDL